jgi:hypothetical protein
VSAADATSEDPVGEDGMEAALRAVLTTVDRVPGAAIAAANAAIGWRNVDADLALLATESELELAHLRGAQPRLLTFHGRQTVIELQVSSVAGTARLLGQLDPPCEADVSVESAARTRNTHADSRGRFSVVGLDDSWMRVIVTRADGASEPTATEWFRA